MALLGKRQEAGVAGARGTWRRGAGVGWGGGRQAQVTQGLAGHVKEFGFIVSIAGRKLLKPTSDFINMVV